MAKCEICGQPQWTKIVDPQTGRFIPEGTWDNGGIKYKAVKHTCTGGGQQQIQNQNQNPSGQDSQTFIPKQNVGSANSILFQQIETMNTVLGQILDIVMQKSTSSNVGVAGVAATVSLLKDNLQDMYEEIRLARAELHEIKNHFKISSFQPASQLAPREAQPDDLEELADTDDQTKLDNRSINYAGQDD